MTTLPGAKRPTAGEHGATRTRDERDLWSQAGPPVAVVVIAGDGIGPEVMAATQLVLEAAEAPLELRHCDAGTAAFERGIDTGLPRETLDAIEEARVVLKGPLATSLGGGGKSANVTLRKLFETHANIRPAREMPGVGGPFAGRGIDLVVVRENVEDLYAGIEHMQTPTVAQCLKLVSEAGCEKIVRSAFAYASASGRGSVHCATKSNILKLTEGMLQRAFERIAGEYPEIEAEHLLVDNCAQQLVLAPEQFEVIVTTNMNGDILSDLTSGLVGGLGLAPSANIGDDVAIFEPVHGTAPGIAGHGIANPTAMLRSAAMLLSHVGQPAVGRTIEQAVLVTLAEGACLTADVANGRPHVGTMAFAERVARNLGREHEPCAAPARELATTTRRRSTVDEQPVHGRPAVEAPAELVGVDVFLRSLEQPATLGSSLESIAADGAFELRLISNRGTKVYPDADGSPALVDHWRCRFVTRGDADEPSDEDVLALLHRIGAAHSWMHVEKLHRIDGREAFTAAQGEQR